MLLVRDLAVEAGARTLLSGVSFSVQAGDKIGLVGPNGAGKTTLLRVIAEGHEPVTGHLTATGTVGYLPQESSLSASSDETALERILAARAIGDLERTMENVRSQMEVVDSAERDKLIHRYARLEDEFTVRGGYAAKAEAKRFAAGLGIVTEELEQPFSTMSGGQRRRVELARILFSEAETLILDEPTNHLDLDAKEWLMRYLSDYPGGVLVVSHDLPLLDASITSVLAAEDGRLDAYKGNYTFYLAERDRRREHRRRERLQQESEIARLQQGIRRFKGSSEKLAKRARSWETRVERLQSELVDVNRERRHVKVAFPQPQASGKIPLRAEGLAKAFGHNVVFMDVDVVVDRGERLIIMGLNGAGKTTLLRILAGVEHPDLGAVELGHNASLGYYAQEHEDIDLRETVLETMKEVTGLPDPEIRGILGLFLLADKIDQQVGTLSGGERTKLALARIVVGAHNVLLLDEPTNNLDPQAKQALLRSLDAYEGTIVLVSHDVDFVAALGPTRAILMPDGDSDLFSDDLLDLVRLA